MAAVSPASSSPSPTEEHGNIFDLDIVEQKRKYRRKKGGKREGGGHEVRNDSLASIAVLGQARFKTPDWLFADMMSAVSYWSGRGRGLCVPELGVGDPDVPARDEHWLLHHQPRHRAGTENTQVPSL